MTLVKLYLVPRKSEEEMKAFRRQLLTEHWPGDDKVPENTNIRCKRTDILEENNGFVTVGAIYEG